MKKRHVSVEILSGSCVVILAGAGIWIIQKKSRNICTGNRGFTERSLWNTYIAAAGGMEHMRFRQKNRILCMESAFIGVKIKKIKFW